MHCKILTATIVTALAAAGISCCRLDAAAPAASAHGSAAADEVLVLREIRGVSLSRRQQRTIADQIAALDHLESAIRKNPGSAASTQEAGSLEHIHDTLLAGGGPPEAGRETPGRFLQHQEDADRRLARARAQTAGAIARALTVAQLNVIRQETGVPPRTSDAPQSPPLLAPYTRATVEPGMPPSLRALDGPLLGLSEVGMLRSNVPGRAGPWATIASLNAASTLRAEAGFDASVAGSGPGFMDLRNQITTSEQSIQGMSDLEYRQSLANALVETSEALRAPANSIAPPPAGSDPGNTLDELACLRFFLQPAAVSYMRRFAPAGAQAPDGPSPGAEEIAKADGVADSILRIRQIAALNLSDDDLASFKTRLAALENAKLAYLALEQQDSAPVLPALTRIQTALLNTGAPAASDLAGVDAAMKSALQDGAALARQRHDLLDTIRKRLNRSQLDGLRVEAGFEPMQTIAAPSPTKNRGDRVGASSPSGAPAPSPYISGSPPPHISDVDLVARTVDFEFLSGFRTNSMNFYNSKYVDQQFTDAYAPAMNIEGDPAQYEAVRSRIVEGCEMVSQISDEQFQQLRHDILASVMNQLGLHLSPDPDFNTTREIDDEAVANLFLRPDVVTYLQNRVRSAPATAVRQR